MSLGIFKAGKGNYKDDKTVASKDDVFLLNIPTHTNQLINNGADGTNKYLTTLDLYGDANGYGIISGDGLVWKGDYKYDVTPYRYLIKGIEYSTELTPKTFDPSDAVLDRIDVVVGTFDVNGNGLIEIVKGEPSATAVKPAITSENQIELTFVKIDANTTVPAEVTDTVVYDENLQVAGGEWDVVSQDVNIDPDNIDVAESGTKSIKFGVDAPTASSIFFNHTVTKNADDISNILFRVYLTTTDVTTVVFRIGTSPSNKIAEVRIFNGDYGFDNQLLEVWQEILIPKAALTFNGVAASGNYTYFEFIKFYASGDYYIDNIVLQEGLEDIVLPKTDITKTSQLINDGADEVNPYITALDVVHPTNTSEFTNDGEDGVNPFITLLDVPNTATGLEAIDEGNGIGWRLIGRDPANYGNIGLGAIDFSLSNEASTTNGALGTYSVVFGVNNKVPTEYTMVFGYGNTINANTGYHYIFGSSNIINQGLYTYSNLIVGNEHIVSDYANAVFGYAHNVKNSFNGSSGTIVSGLKNVSDSYYGAFFGAGLKATGSYETVIGVSNVDFTDNNTGNSTVQRSLFTIGNGTISATGTRITPRDAFKVYFNGQVVAPSLTTALITAEATGRILTTKEWVNAAISTGVGGVSNLYTADGTIPASIERIVSMGDASTRFSIYDSLGNYLAKFGEGVVNFDAGSTLLYMADGSMDLKADYIQLQNSALTNQIYLPPTTGKLSITAKNGMEFSIGAAYPFATVGQVLMATSASGAAVWSDLPASGNISRRIKVYDTDIAGLNQSTLAENVALFIANGVYYKDSSDCEYWIEYIENLTEVKNQWRVIDASVGELNITIDNLQEVAPFGATPTLQAVVTASGLLTNTTSGTSIWGTNSSTGRLIRIDNTNFGRGIYLTNSSGGYGMYVDNTATGYGIQVDNTGTSGIGVNISNPASTGKALSIINSAGGKGINISNSNSGDAILINGTTPSTGKLLVLQSNNANTFTVDKLGNTISAGTLQLNTYGSGTKTGTATYALAVDATGNVIETALGGATPNLQAVTTEGNTIVVDTGNTGIIINTNEAGETGLELNATSGGTGLKVGVTTGSTGAEITNSGVNSGLDIINTSSGNGVLVLSNGTGAAVKVSGTTTAKLFSGNNNFVETSSITKEGVILGTQFRISALNTAPATASSVGTLGEVRITAGFIYVCIATNTWVRAALITW